jgi:hypothetical protein
MRLKSTLIKIAFGFVIACFALGAAVFWMADPMNLRAPRDQKLVTSFHDHRTAFERLRQMATEDSEKGPYFSESFLDGRLDEMRKREYRRLLFEIHPGLIATVNYGTVRFCFAGGGLSAISPGWGKGIEYVPGDYERKGRVVENLDEANKLPPGVYLRKIEPNWFIFYQRTDD